MPPLTCRSADFKALSFIIGYLNLFGSLALTLLILVSFINLAVILCQDNEFINQDTIVILVVLGVLLVILQLDVVFVTVLIIGLHKNKPGYLKAYLTYSTIFLMVFVIDFIVSATIVGEITVGAILFHVFPMMLCTGFLLVIGTRYYQMTDRYKDPAAVYYTTVY